MKKFLYLSLLALLGASVVRAEPSRADLVARVETCEALLREFQVRAETAIPADVWKRAKGLIILNQVKVGLVLGVQDGFGIITVKRPDGWSLPVLINAGEASLGLQLGANSKEAVFVILDETIPRKLFSNKVNLGVDAKAVAGPKAAEKERTNHEEIFKTPLLAYTKTIGLFAGATVKAGHISRNDAANFTLYNTRYTMPELLYSDWVTPPPEIQPLIAYLKQLSP